MTIHVKIHTPSYVEEILAFVEDSFPVNFVAGATDWSIQNKIKMNQELNVIDLSSVRDLKGIKKSQEHIMVGAMETMTAISGNLLLQLDATCLSESAGKLGSWQIRNCATIGGNIANASPAADTPVALAALGAEVILRSRKNIRILPIQEMTTTPGRSILENGEFISSVRIPVVQKRVSAFGKIGSRSEVSIARLNMAGSFTFGEDGQMSRISLYVGALGAGPLRATRAEEILMHSRCSNITEYCHELSQLVEETIPGRYSMVYKRRAIQGLGIDVLDSLREKARREGYSL